MSGSVRWRWVGTAAMALVALVYGVPLFWMVSTSFKTGADLSEGTWLPSGLNTEPYTAFLQEEFVPATLNSVYIASLTTVISLVLAVPAAYGLSRVRSRLVTPILLLVLFVQMVPTSATFIPLFKLLSQMGLIDTLLGVALADASLLVPFAIVLLRPGFMGIPTEVEEAARVDGAGNWRYLLQIALPLLRNTALVTAAIVFVAAWGELVYALTFLFDEDRYPLSVYIAASRGRYENTPQTLMAVSALASLPVLAILLAIQNQLRRGLTLGAVR